MGVEPGHLLAGEGEGGEQDEEPDDEEAGKGGAAEEGPGSAGEGENEGQELVGGHDHQVVEPGLHAAAHVLLRLPVVDRAPGAAADAAGVRPERRHEGGVDECDHGGGDEPGARTPAQAGDSGHDGRDGEAEPDHQALAKRRSIANAGQGSAIGIGAPEVEGGGGEDGLEQLFGEGSEEGKGEGSGEDEQVAGAGQVVPGETGPEPREEGPEGGEYPGHGVEEGRAEEASSGRVGPVGAEAGAREVERQVAVQVEEEEGDEEEGRFLGAEGEGEGDREDDEPAGAPVVQVAPDGDDHGEDEGGEVDVHPQEAAEVDERGREGEEGDGGERSGGSQPAPQGQRGGYDEHAEEGGRDTRGVVGGGEDDEGEGLDEVEEGAVEGGAVAVGPFLRQVPGPDGVDALVVVEGAGAEVPETEGEGGGEDGEVGNQHPVRLDTPDDAIQGGGLRLAVSLRGHGALTSMATTSSSSSRLFRPASQWSAPKTVIAGPRSLARGTP